MRDQYSRISASGVNVLVVAPTKATFIKSFEETFGPFPFPIYGDPSRKLFRSMGHVSMTKWVLLGMASVGFLFRKKRYFIPKEENKKRLVLKAMKTQDVYIQGGTWLFSTKGKVIWKHIDKSPNNHATITEILENVQVLTSK